MARRGFCRRVDCDVDYDDPAAAWIGDALALAADARSRTGIRRQTEAASRAVAEAKPTAFDKKHPFPATIIDNSSSPAAARAKRRGTSRFRWKAPASVFEPGDALGVAPRNDPALVAKIIGRLGLKAPLRR